MWLLRVVKRKCYLKIFVATVCCETKIELNKNYKSLKIEIVTKLKEQVTHVTRKTKQESGTC